MIKTLLFVLILITSQQTIYSQSTLKVLYDKDNIAAGKIEGLWEINNDLKGFSTSKNYSDIDMIRFICRPSIVDSLPEKYNSIFKDYIIYQAGIIVLHRQNHPFILISNSGNPVIVWFRDRDLSEKVGEIIEEKEYLGDTESFIFFIAVANQASNDLLFIGGDFNEGALKCYKRKK